MEQDAAFGIRQIVDVAMKSLSSGINDRDRLANRLTRVREALVAAPPSFVRIDQN
ncbi:DUF2254 family protein [Thiocystis violacea]|uniref:DUF2254 family protein n=1 Tax=Thiocystis violacea TaxID=13725 RepID=UPI0031F7A7DF